MLVESKPVCVFTVDVEDWFHILDVPSAPPISSWDRLPSRVERNFLGLLDLLDECGVSATCFFLGWVARRYPQLVKQSQSRGHEVASHGFAHRLAYEVTPKEFHEDAAQSKRTIEDLIGTEIRGYRSAGFSVTRQAPWFFDELAAAGYRYDSSVFPAPRSHGGLRNGCFAPYLVQTNGGSIVEFPVTVAPVLGWPVCFFGGGYLRLFPLRLIRHMTRRVLKDNRPVIFYVHPREIDPGHPRLPMSPIRAFKSYVNLGTTEAKVRSLLHDFTFITLDASLGEHVERTCGHAV
jgi:polysaccharide deacetylase family protein (PEP-CTERM system associated)